MNYIVVYAKKQVLELTGENDYDISNIAKENCPKGFEVVEIFTKDAGINIEDLEVKLKAELI